MNAVLRLSVALVLLLRLGFACGNTSELAKTGHMDLGVRIDTANADEYAAFRRALNYWATVLDMEWHYGSSRKTCSIELVDEPTEAFASYEAAHIYTERMVIAVNPAYRFTIPELYSISVHELGHAFGLDDRPEKIAANRLSFMRAGNNNGSERLDAQDFMNLAARHRLRHSETPKGEGRVDSLQP